MKQKRNKQRESDEKIITVITSIILITLSNSNKTTDRTADNSNREKQTIKFWY